MFIHGGYWQRFDRKAFAFVAEPLRAAGAAVALIGYDLAPAVDMDRSSARSAAASPGSTARARRRATIPRGSSSPATRRAATSRRWRSRPTGRRTACRADLIKGVCAISGIFDLEPIRLCYLNEVLGLDADAGAPQQPAAPAAGPAPCPVTVAVGETETAAFHEQSRAYAAKLARRRLALPAAWSSPACITSRS